jgi:hypothetical protein
VVLFTILAIAFHAAEHAAIAAIAGRDAGVIPQLEAANLWVKVEGTADVLAVVAWLAAAGAFVASRVRTRVS